MIKHPPIQLAKLIKRINLLPPETHLSELYIQSQGVRLKIRSEDAAFWGEADQFRSRFEQSTYKWTQAARRALYVSLVDLTDEFRDYIWGNVAPKIDLRHKFSERGIDTSTLWGGTRRAVERYENFRHVRNQIHGLARFVSQLPSWEQQFENSRRKAPTKLQSFASCLKSPTESFVSDSYPIPLLGLIRYEIDNNGSVLLKPDDFTEAMISKDTEGHSVDVRRIRECAKCRRIFWAGRVDNFVCSSKCRLRLKAEIRSGEITNDRGSYWVNRIKNEGKRKKSPI
jgi:hypothetical protein